VRYTVVVEAMTRRDQKPVAEPRTTPTKVRDPARSA
jgi:hypothetical protein